MTYRPAIAAALVAATLAPWSASRTLGEPDYLAPESLEAAGLTKFWQFRLPLDPNQRVLSGFLVDDALYMSTDDGYVYALDARTGTPRWIQPVTRSGYRVMRPAHAGDNVIFITAVDLQVYDRHSGDGRARRPLRFPSGSGAVSDGARVFVGGLDAKLHSYETDSLLRDWRIATDAPIESTPALFGNAIFCATTGHTVFAATRSSKAFRWDTIVGGAVTADLVADESGVYVACEDHSLYLFDVDFGYLRWRAIFGAALHDPPLISKTLVYQFVPGEGLAAVETGLPHEISERVRWKLPQGRVALTTHEDTVYVLSDREQLLAVRAKDGQVMNEIPAAGLTITFPVAAEPTIYLASADGRIFCARPKGVPLLRAADLRVAAGLAAPAASKEASATPPTATQPSAEPQKGAAGGAPVGGKSDVSKGFRPGGQ